MRSPSHPRERSKKSVLLGFQSQVTREESAEKESVLQRSRF